MADPLQALLREAVRRLRAAPAASALLVHHNDADGLTSAALLSVGLQAEGCVVEPLAVEKILPEVLAAIHARQAAVTVYADLAGQNAGAIAALADSGTCTIIVDHPRPERTQAPHVWLVNPEPAGLSGDREASCSAVAYQFARYLLPEATRYADLAVLGALGDGQAVSGRLQGLNASALADDLTRLGAVGYFRDGPALAVAAWRDGLDDRARAALRLLTAMEEERFAAEEARLRRGGLRRLGRIQWFDVGDRFAPMGVKSVGTFCERLAAAGWTDPADCVVGMQALPGEIPGLGRFDWNLRKVSVRVPAGLAGEVLNGRFLDLMQLVPAACEAVGGFADGCHRLAAAATIPGDAAEAFARALARGAGIERREEAP